MAQRTPIPPDAGADTFAAAAGNRYVPVEGYRNAAMDRGMELEAEARDALGRLHIPSFDTPSAAVRAFNALVAMRRAAVRGSATPEFVAGLEAPLLAEVEHRARRVLAAGEVTAAGAPGLRESVMRLREMPIVW